MSLCQLQKTNLGHCISQSSSVSMNNFNYHAKLEEIGEESKSVVDFDDIR